MRAHLYTAEGEGKWRPRMEYDVPDGTDAAALTFIGKDINQGESRHRQLWRDHGFPPLGVGDLIVLDRTRYWVCEPDGWKKVERPETVQPEQGADPTEERRVRRGGF